MQIVRPKSYSFSDVVTSIVEDEAPFWDVAATYSLGDEVIRDHRVFVSAIDGNLAIDPLLEDQSLIGVRWVQKSYTNAFQFMDGALSNRSLGVGSIVVTISNLSGVDTLVVFGLTGQFIDVVARSLSGATVFTLSQNISGREVSNWFDWFFKPFGDYSDKLVATGMPSNVAEIEITLTGGSVAMGEVVVGDVIDIGKSLFGAQGEAISYSKLNYNAYGVAMTVKGPVRNEMRYPVMASRERFQVIKPLMDRLQGELVAAIGAVDRPSTIHLGLLGTVRWTESLPDHYEYSFVLRGVI